MDNEPLLDDQSQQPPLFSSTLLLNLYAGHFLARWGARMWEFSVGLYMINVWPDSLFLAAAYGVVESASTALIGPLIGRCVHKLSYVKVLKLWLFSQNISFIVAGGAVIAILIHPDTMSSNYILFIALIILINISGAVGVLSTLSGTILVEREWVVVISEGQPPGTLTKMNSIIRRIDLTCKLLAPVVSGFIISFVSLTASAMALALWNVLSVFLQFWLLMSVYNGIPRLKETNESEEQPESNSSNRTMIARFLNVPYVSAWRMYVKQDHVVLPGLALALLYFTVLSFGTLMTAALEWQGIPAYVIGIARGISATVGIVDVSSVMCGFSICEWETLIGIFANGWGGVFAPRAMDDHVAESDRCVVGGVQNSIQSVLDLMTYIMGLLISNPKDFWKLTFLSFMVVTLAATLYSVHVYRVRKHLLHLDKLLLLIGWPTRSSNYSCGE
ncbi:solute carrier family 40 member 2 [Phtheirospermum japonicum]|uniref:Solute carrier family 40 member n=1 Tax=Phtheirospermum japonicum TaxID=374723 RepID=A0A830BXE9_9LAMI|nr:solute carrier family 40 member 2 [Phtheirospermum japonicum]